MLEPSSSEDEEDVVSFYFYFLNKSLKGIVDVNSSVMSDSQLYALKV